MCLPVQIYILRNDLTHKSEEEKNQGVPPFRPLKKHTKMSAPAGLMTPHFIAESFMFLAMGIFAKN